jgi:hypothetical protein
LEGVCNQCIGVKTDDGIDRWVESLNSGKNGRNHIETGGDTSEQCIVHAVNCSLPAVEGFRGGIQGNGRKKEQANARQAQPRALHVVS